MAVVGDNYPEETLNEIILWLEADMAGHITTIKTLNDTALSYRDVPKFLQYVMENIAKEYLGYIEAKKQRDSYVKLEEAQPEENKGETHAETSY